jgi:hypothetical protein
MGSVIEGWESCLSAEPQMVVVERFESRLLPSCQPTQCHALDLPDSSRRTAMSGRPRLRTLMRIPWSAA